MRLKMMVAALATAAAMVTTAASPASAHTGGPPTGETLKCWTYGGLNAICWEPAGDDVWVRDLFSDGASGFVTWETNDGIVGWCRNSHGHLTWHECQEDIREGAFIKFKYETYDQETGKFTHVFGWTGWVSSI